MTVSPEILARIEAQAGMTVRDVVKQRARRFRDRPGSLDIIAAGLSRLDGGALIARAADLHAEESRRPQRLVGFGGEVRLLNIQAVRLYGRWLKRFGASRREAA